MIDYEAAIQAATDLTSAFEDFKSRYDAKLDEIDQHLVRLNRPGTGGSDRRTGGDLARERAAIGMFIKSGDDRELKAMATDDSPLGGYLTLPQVSATMTRRLWDSSPIRRLARIQNISTGDAWVEPVDRDQSSAVWVGEREARPALDTPELGLLTIVLNEIYSSQQVSQKLLDLSFADVGAWLENKIADKFSRTEAAAFLTGNGVAQPRGLLECEVAGRATFSFLSPDFSFYVPYIFFAGHDGGS